MICEACGLATAVTGRREGSTARMLCAICAERIKIQNEEPERQVQPGFRFVVTGESLDGTVVVFWHGASWHDADVTRRVFDIRAARHGGGSAVLIEMPIERVLEAERAWRAANVGRTAKKACV